MFYSNMRIASLGRRFALFLLCCNIFVCSIPRCDFFQSSVKEMASLWQADNVEAGTMSHCHGVAQVENAGLPALSEPDLCQCELLRFVSTLPVEPQRSVTLPRQSPLSWDLVHILRQSTGDFMPGIEPPYPEV